MPTKEQAIENVHVKIRALWGAYRELSDYEIATGNENLLSDDDYAIWGLVTDHPACKNRLNKE